MNMLRRRLALAGVAVTGSGDDPTSSAAAEVATFMARDGTPVHCRRWLPHAATKAVLQIVHGAAEHGGRYDRFAQALAHEGYAVYATDHRGHGLTRLRTGRLGDAGPDAWNRMVGDELQLSERIHRSHPDSKLVLLGHSMGSFLAQDFITREPALIDALVLCGTAYGPPPPQAALDLAEAAAKVNPLGASAMWAARFEEFNLPFTGRKGAEWLSRDPLEVQKYTGDPMCGFAFSNELVRDFYQGLASLRDPAREANIPTGLPVLVIQGGQDPVGGQLAATQALLDRLQALGLQQVAHRFYEGARHELLNEINRDEVTNDILVWLRATLG